MRRGRPPYPDVLTPREQEVLALLREGLTNQQIADRLGISLYGARYHVSEILSKLGVSSREEAAAWQPQAPLQRRGLHAVLAAPFERLASLSAIKLAGSGAIAAAGLGLALLALGVTLSAQEPELPTGLGKLAYLRDGNLWVQTLPDGGSRQLTFDGEASTPRWSPSGEWLMAGLEVMRADGSDRRRAPLCSGWSPVSDLMLCIVDDLGTWDAVRIEAPDGTVVRTIDLAALVAARQPDLEVESAICTRWSPDGTHLACRVEGSRAPPEGLGEDEAAAYSRYSGLWVASTDGSDAWETVDNYDLLPEDFGAVGITGWTADGESVLFQVATGFSASIQSDGLRLYTVPRDGGEVRGIEATLLSRDELQDWRFAGSTLAVTEGGWRETWTNKRVAVIDLTTGIWSHLTPPDEAAFSPAVSPDGSTIAYVSAPDIGAVGGGEAAREGAGRRRIWLMDADGANKRPLTNDPAYRDERPQWSRDGRYVMFARIDAEDRASVWIVAASGGKPVELAGLSLSPSAPQDPPLWFGYYGYVAWDRYYAWWQP